MTTAVFDAVAPAYDAEFTNTRLARWLRARVWQHLAQTFLPGQRVLELGCGTGEDARWLAQRGVSVLATDISEGMLAIAERKAGAFGVEFAQQDAANLTVSGEFDGAFANFGVLNCVPDLRDFAERLPVRRGGRFIGVVMGPFCAWETAWYLAHGDVRRATRRWRGQAVANISGARLAVWYPSPRTVHKAFAPAFELEHCEGLGTLLPPSYLSRLATWSLARLDGHMPFGAWWADHYLAIFKRR